MLGEDQDGILEGLVQQHHRAGFQKAAELQFLEKVGGYLRDGFLIDGNEHLMRTAG